MYWHWGGVFPISAATNDDVKEVKERVKKQKEIRKSKIKVLNEKSSKDARKLAKQYAKEGWQVGPGKLPIEKQLDRSFLYQMEEDDYGQSKYMMGSAQSTGQNLDAAKMQAKELARLDLATSLETEIVGLVENAISNEQLAAEEAASITRTVMDSKNKIAQSLGRVIVAVEMYRVLPNRNKEVSLTVYYSAEQAREAAKRVVKDNLENKTEELSNKVDQLFNNM